MEKFFSSSLSIERLKCLRNDCTLNDCKLCIEFCPYDALVIEANKLNIKSNLCTNCASCVGICPTEAIKTDGFDANLFIMGELAKEVDEIKSKTLQKTLKLKCTNLGACLSSFDEQNLITLTARSNRAVEIDTGECEKCPLNEKNHNVLNRIKFITNETNRFLKTIGMDKNIEILNTAAQDRRGFLKALFGQAVAIKEAINFELPDIKTKIPLKTLLLKNTLKDIAEKINLKIDEENFSFLTLKQISDSCTNCRSCVEFCPTNALFYSSDYDKIYFQSGKCINCSICDSVCKDNSFTKLNEKDLVRFMFDKAVPLIEHTIIECDHCKIGFASKQGSTTCPSCMNFKTDFASMFITAKDLEKTRS